MIYAEKVAKINSNLGKLCSLLDLSDDEHSEKETAQMADKRSYSHRQLMLKKSSENRKSETSSPSSNVKKK